MSFILIFSQLQVGYWARRGGDVNVRDPFAGRELTPLLHAAYFGHVDTVRYLVRELGAQLDAVEPQEGRCALHLAAFAGHTEVVQVLVRELGLPVDALNRRLRTPLHDAAAMGQTHTVEALLHMNASVGRKYAGTAALPGESHPVFSNCNATALHDAAEDGFLETCKVLLLHGAALHALDGYRCTARQRAERRGVCDDPNDVRAPVLDLLAEWDTADGQRQIREADRRRRELRGLTGGCQECGGGGGGGGRVGCWNAEQVLEAVHPDSGAWNLRGEWTDVLNYNGEAPSPELLNPLGDYRRRLLPLVKRDILTKMTRLQPFRRPDFGASGCNPGHLIPYGTAPDAPERVFRMQLLQALQTDADVRLLGEKRLREQETRRGEGRDDSDEVGGEGRGGVDEGSGEA